MLFSKRNVEMSFWHHLNGNGCPDKSAGVSKVNNAECLEEFDHGLKITVLGCCQAVDFIKRQVFAVLRAWRRGDFKQLLFKHIDVLLLDCECKLDLALCVDRRIKLRPRGDSLLGSKRIKCNLKLLIWFKDFRRNSKYLQRIVMLFHDDTGSVNDGQEADQTENFGDHFQMQF